MLNDLLLPLGGMIWDPVLRAYAEYRFVTLKVRLVMLVVLVALALSATHYIGMMGVMMAYVFSFTAKQLLLFGLTTKNLNGSRLSHLLSDLSRSGCCGGWPGQRGAPPDHNLCTLFQAESFSCHCLT
jgi:hypothetical protein